MSFEEQIMSKDKYSSIFSCQMEAIVFIILQIFFATRAVLTEYFLAKTGEYPNRYMLCLQTNIQAYFCVKWRLNCSHLLI